MSTPSELYNIADSYPALIKKSGKLLSATLNQRFKEAGFATTTAQWVALVHLANQGGLSQQELAEQYDSNKVTVFRLIEKLEEQGLIVRKADPDDGRCKRVFLTPKGRRLQTQLAALAKQNAADFVSGVSKHDLEITKKVLKKIIGNAS